MLKIRLARHGRKRFAYYHIVAADSRAPRDGRYIEQIGIYNPNDNPARIEIDFDKALDWLKKGAQPTETVRAILSYKGVLYKKHLLEGVKKGAFDEAEAEKRFDKWMQEKEAKIQAKRDRLANDEETSIKLRLEAEIKVKEKMAEDLAKKYAKQSEEQKEEASEEEETAEVAEVTEEAETKEEPKAEVKEEEPAAEVVEEPKAEAKEETVVEEPKAEKEVKEEPVVEEPKDEAEPVEEKEKPASDGAEA